MRSPSLAFLLLGSWLLIIGCGGPPSSTRVPVKGAVSLNGTPVDLGTILFFPVKSGGIKVGCHIVDGQYSMDAKDGPEPGKHRVELYWPRKTGNKITRSGGIVADETKEAFAPSYNTASTLVAEFKPGDNEVDFLIK